MTPLPPPTLTALTPLHWLPHTWTGHPPGLSHEDRIIWHRYRTTANPPWHWYAYNVPIGGIECPDPTTPDALARAWTQCTAKRIDVLAYRHPHLAILELRHNAGVSAIGSLLAYRHLWRELNPRPPHPRLILITNSIAPDTLRAATRYRIHTITVPD